MTKEKVHGSGALVVGLLALMIVPFGLLELVDAGFNPFRSKAKVSLVNVEYRPVGLPGDTNAWQTNLHVSLRLNVNRFDPHADEVSLVTSGGKREMQLGREWMMHLEVGGLRHELAIPNFHRRAKTLNLEGRLGGEPFFLSFDNPLDLSAIREFKPQSFPITNDLGDVTAVVDGWKPGGPPYVPQVTFYMNGAKVPWFSATHSAFDATGNHLAFEHDRLAWEEPAWRYYFWVKRTRVSTSPDRIDLLTTNMPAENTFVEFPMDRKFLGVKLKRVVIGGPGGFRTTSPPGVIEMVANQSTPSIEYTEKNGTKAVNWHSRHGWVMVELAEREGDELFQLTLKDFDGEGDLLQRPTVQTVLSASGLKQETYWENTLFFEPPPWADIGLDVPPPEGLVTLQLAVDRYRWFQVDLAPKTIPDI